MPVVMDVEAGESFGMNFVTYLTGVILSYFKTGTSFGAIRLRPNVYKVKHLCISKNITVQHKLAKSCKEIVSAIFVHWSCVYISIYFFCFPSSVGNRILRLDYVFSFTPGGP